jgi:hypothetical protein
MKSDTSGQAGGLENHGPLKAVVNQWPPKRWQPLEHLQLVKAFVFGLLFFDVFPNDLLVSANC